MLSTEFFSRLFQDLTSIQGDLSVCIQVIDTYLASTSDPILLKDLTVMRYMFVESLVYEQKRPN